MSFYIQMEPVHTNFAFLEYIIVMSYTRRKR